MTKRIVPLLSLCLICALPYRVVVAASFETATPIKHLVVLYMENSSFDGYFGVYPTAENPRGSPAFEALKPATYQTGHPGMSEPLDQQVFLAKTLNRLHRLPEWRHMAVMVAWDNSDGWTDHVMPPIVNLSATSFDTGSVGQPLCGRKTQGPGARCAYGPRIPFLVISPFAKKNYVSGQLADQTSITRFIEDNWLNGRRISDISFDNIAGSLEHMFDFSRVKHPRRLFLDPLSGEPIRQRP